MVFHYLSRFAFWLINTFRENFLPSHVAISCLMGFFLGLTPALNLQWLFVLGLSIILRTNVIALVLGFFVGWPLSQLLETFFDSIGRYVLMQIPWATPFWAWMYHAPLLPYTRFNQTLVMGGSLFYVVTVVPLYFLVKCLFAKYSDRIDTMLTASRFYRTLSHHEQLYG